MAIGERDLRRFLVDRIARACELSPADVDPDRLLEQYGIASRDAVAITAELEDVLGRQLEPASLWRYPTLNQLIRGVLGSTHPDGIPITRLDPLSGDEIAVIGLARRDTTDERIPWEVAREALKRACVPGLILAENRIAVFGTETPLLGRTCPSHASSTPVATAMTSLRDRTADIALTVLPEPSRSCQMVVLKRLSDAERDFDQILALCTDPDEQPVADFLEAVLAADRGITDELLPWPVGQTVSTSEAVVRRAWPADPTPSSGPTRLLLSDVSIDLIQEYAGVLAAYLRDDSSRNTADVANTLVRRMARGPVRAAVVGRARADLTAGLTALAQGNDHPGVLSARATVNPPRPTWSFPANMFPAQRTHVVPNQPGPGGSLRELAESVPGFAGVIVELDPLVVWATGVSVREAVRTSTVPTGGELPVAFAVQVALALSLRQYGVVPAAIVAAGSGEVAAAVVAGALTATEGARVIAALATTPDQLASALAGLAPAEPRLPFYSATSTEATPFGAEYWAANLKQAVALSTALSRAAADGHEHFFHLTADALGFHTQLATLEVLGHPIIAPPGRVTDLPIAHWHPTT